MGWVSSFEKLQSGRRRCHHFGRQHDRQRQRELLDGPAKSQAPCTSGNSKHENRETSETPEANLRDRPAGEGNSRTSRAYVFEESDSETVPMNHSNKSGKPPAESEEGRPLIKENPHPSNTLSTQSKAGVSQGQAGVRKAAGER